MKLFWKMFDRLFLLDGKMGMEAFTNSILRFVVVALAMIMLLCGLGAFTLWLLL